MKEITHAEYIKSPYWRKFSKSILDDPEVCCAICKRPKWSIYQKKTKKHKAGDKKRLIVLNLHHVNYENLGVGEDNVIPICRRCHILAHDLERAAKQSPETFGEVYEHLKENTEWDFDPTEKYIVPDDFVLSAPRKSKDNVDGE